MNSKYTLIWLTFAIGLVMPIRAQAPSATYTDEQLDQLLGPIALYPDPLVAIILPASTVPSDITLAANYLASSGVSAEIDSQSWDSSVKALAHYPDVVKWMSTNRDWTQAVGVAFAQQPAEVMKSIQQLRARARAVGTLVNTPQQSIAMAGDNIRIVPAQPNVIYVPQYDPLIVYERPVGYVGPFVTFGIGFPVGIWLGYACDWDDFGIWIGPWRPGWVYRRDWRYPTSESSSWHSWRPDPRRSRAVVRDFYRPEVRLPRPGPMGGYRLTDHPQEVSPRVAIPHPSLPPPDYLGRGMDMPRPATNPAAPTSPLFGGYNRGTQTRQFSGRGQTSRSTPIQNLRPPANAAPASESTPTNISPTTVHSSATEH